ncbi:MAG TPA: FMN-binding protein [Burkholderiales bacterium]|nr:FMN-binding protein [Burkholderiales bacterium]
MDVFNKWLLIPAAVIAAPTCAYATQYLTLEQAQQAVFPGAAFTPAFIAISEAQSKEIERRTGVSVRLRDQRVWRVSTGGFFIVDEVVGKHELITYAVGLNADGSLHQIEIMDYRESYGYEIRNAAWRRQFVGKRDGDPLKLDVDIKNIGGATLSCRHITDGVRRLLALYDVALK